MNEFFQRMAQHLGQVQDQVGNVPPFNKKFFIRPLVEQSRKAHLETGDKIILPESALHHLSRLEIVYPMMFRITNPSNNRSTYCGVSEFSAPEGRAYIPLWMMHVLGLQSGGAAMIRGGVSVKKGTYVQFQPHSVRFVELANPKAVLEHALRSFTCLHKGDTISVEHLKKTYYLNVKELKPTSVVSVYETDLQLDFAPALDLKETDPRHPNYKKPEGKSGSSGAAPMDSRSDIPTLERKGASSVGSSSSDAPSNDSKMTIWGASYSDTDWDHVPFRSDGDVDFGDKTYKRSRTGNRIGGSSYFDKLGSGRSIKDSLAGSGRKRRTRGNSKGR